MNRSGLLAWILPALLSSQTLDPGLLFKAPTAAWPTYNGDYSGRRFSPLTQID
jgi:glucose dehydrogenase